MRLYYQLLLKSHPPNLTDLIRPWQEGHSELFATYAVNKMTQNRLNTSANLIKNTNLGNLERRIPIRNSNFIWHWQQ